MIKNSTKPAKPITWIEKIKTDSMGHTMDVIRVELGLTKREHFAAMAMQGIISNSQLLTHDIDIISTSISFADELLKQLEPTK